MKKEIITRLHKQFEDYVHGENGVEYWLARELQGLLGYAKWANFLEVIGKAKLACETSKHAVSDHFADVGKMIELAPVTNGKVKVVLNFTFIESWVLI